MLRLQEPRFYLLSQPNGAAIGLLQVRWSSLRRPYGCISRLRSITRCREIGQSGFSGYSTKWQIFPLIAGTYTPFTLGALRGAVDWTLFAAVWSLAILGIGFFVFGGLSFHRLSVCACTSGAPVIWQSHFSFRENCAPPLASIEGRGCAASQDGGGPSSRIIVEDTQF